MSIPLLIQFAYGALCPIGLLSAAAPGSVGLPTTHPVALQTTQVPPAAFATTSLRTAPGDSIVMVDVTPDSSQSLPAVLVAEVGKARTLGLTPFVDVGASNCPSCVELHHLLRKKPADAQLLQEFAGTYIIALSLDKWPGGMDSLTSLGLPSPVRGIPLFLAIDAKGHMTATLYGDGWGDNNPEGLVPLQHFFQEHMWTSKAQADTAKKKVRTNG